jgi:hypothetical protein
LFQTEFGELFYAPSQCRNPADSFFRYYNDGSRELLDPVIWIDNSIVPLQERFIANDQSLNDQRQLNQAAIDLATENWRQSMHHPGKGNDMFFAYARALRKAGMNLYEMEAKLIEESEFGRSPNERKQQIPSIIATLKQSTRKNPAWA